jgi:hypothetical protein
VLWILCLDDETYRLLAKLQLDQVELVRLAELERADPALVMTKPTRQTIEYYWTCGPAFLLYLLARHPQIETLTYLDADMFLFSDPTPVYDELGPGSILLVHHRWPPEAPRRGPTPRPKGLYNVGLLVFRRTTSALTCLQVWRENCLEWCFDRIEPGRFGDQKYLDDWPARFDGVVVSQHKGIGLAPWNLASYRYRYDDSTIWVNSDRLVLYHFQGLRALTPWLYDPAWRRYGHRIQPNAATRHRIYLPYIRELRAAQRHLRAAGLTLDARDTVRSDDGRIRVLARMILRRRFLVVTDTFAL